MSKAEPTIQKFMTTTPYSIDASCSIYDAQKKMADLKIRHLPVMKDGELFGLVSDRDLTLAMTFLEADSRLVKVADVCHEKPYTVEPDTRLHEVLDEMAANHYGSVLVVQNHKLVGIFTCVDVCRSVSQILQQRFHEN